MEEKGNLFDLMLAELEGYTKAPISSEETRVEPHFCVELELRKLQLVLIPYLRISDILRERGDAASVEILRVGVGHLTVQDIYDTQAVFDRLDILCAHVRTLECKKANKAT